MPKFRIPRKEKKRIKKEIGPLLDEILDNEKPWINEKNYNAYKEAGSIDIFWESIKVGI